jgi:hypothetical protein
VQRRILMMDTMMAKIFETVISYNAAKKIKPLFSEDILSGHTSRGYDIKSLSFNCMLRF